MQEKIIFSRFFQDTRMEIYYGINGRFSTKGEWPRFRELRRLPSIAKWPFSSRRRELHAPRFVRFKLSGASRLDEQILWYLQRESEKGNIQTWTGTKRRKRKKENARLEQIKEERRSEKNIYRKREREGKKGRERRKTHLREKGKKRKTEI